MVRRRGGRIGVDLDHPSQLKLLKTYFNAKTTFPDAKIDVLRTGHGFHIKIYCPSTVSQNLSIRRFLGDDHMRLAFDEVRARYPVLIDWIDTLFSIKLKSGKLTREEPYNIFSEQFYGFKVPCRKWR